MPMKTPKKKERMESYERAMCSFKSHIGHEIRYYSNGHSENTGELLRITTKEDLDYYTPIIILWLKDTPFQVKVYEDQFRECVTCKANKSE